MPYNRNDQQAQESSVDSPNRGSMHFSYHRPVITSVPVPNGAPPMMPLPLNGLLAANMTSTTATPAGNSNTSTVIQLESPYSSRSSLQAVERVESKDDGSHSNAHPSPKNDHHDADDDNTREVAASVLLLAAGGHDKVTKSQQRKQQDDSNNKRDADSTDSTDSKVPLKKRKMLTELCQDDNASIRVSPVSHGSRSMHAMSPENTHSTAYDSDKHTPERGLPSQVVVVHLPTELYRLLEEDDTKVIQWLPHGRAWRIVRWDALRKQILPRSFGGTSVDGFLAQLADWGFTEITDGPDAGAYYSPVSFLMILARFACPICQTETHLAPSHLLFFSVLSTEFPSFVQRHAIQAQKQRFAGEESVPHDQLVSCQALYTKYSGFSP